jgi:hypothetical protein
VTLELHTLRFGTADWLDVCVPTLDAYAERHGLPLTVWDDTDRGYPCVKFCEIDMLKAFLAGDSDFLLYLDADVLIHPRAPLPELVPGLSMATCQHHRERNDHWRNWCVEHFQLRPDDSFDYSNAGIWLCDREAAKRMLEFFKPPFIEEFQEQHQWNLAAYQATKAGMQFNRLPSEWNRYGEDLEPSWFFHLWGEQKMRAYQDIVRAGFLREDWTPTKHRFNFRPETWPSQDKVVVTQFVRDCGLGNQMFEWAAGLAVARRLNIPFRWNWRDTDYREFGLEAFGIGLPDNIDYPIICQRYGQGNREIFERVVAEVAASNERLCGICLPFQSEDCFIDIADEIRELFKLEPMILDTPEGRTPVAVQVRRGDYLKHRRLNVADETYFRNAMLYMREHVEKPHFFIVSDDPKWCQQTFGKLPNVTVMPPQSPIDGLRTMVACKAHAISNSTFGWWGAWLGESGPVVVPEIWYHGAGAYGKWEPAPARWVRVPVGLKQVVEITRPHPSLIVAPPTQEHAIVYPYNAAGSKWHELRYSLRSVEKFFEDKKCPIYVLGTAVPGWLRKNQRVVWVDAWTYQSALVKGTQLAKEILWMNDDIVLTNPVTWDDCRVPRFLKPTQDDWVTQIAANGNPWREGVARLIADLRLHGHTDLRMFSTHTPYVYRRDDAIQIFEKYGVWEKMPFELAYFHEFGKDPQPLNGVRAQAAPFGDALFLNYSDGLLTPELKAAIAEMLPEKMLWETSQAFIQ